MHIKTSIKAFGRIICLIFEDYTKEQDHKNLQIIDFIDLIKEKSFENQSINNESNNNNDDEILGCKLKNKNIEEKFKKLQSIQRNELWLNASSRKLKQIFILMNILRVNSSVIIRYEFAKICCNLLEKCFKNLKENLSNFLENIIAFTQDDNDNIKEMCLKCIKKLQNEQFQLNEILYENFEYLFDNCIKRLPRIIHRLDEYEQLKEFQFLKGFIEIVSENDLKMILSLPDVLEKFCMCLITILDMKLDKELLLEEYALRDMTENLNCNTKTIIKTPWRRFKYCDSIKVIQTIEDIFKILGSSRMVLLIYDHLMELLSKNLSITNEIILCLTLLLGQNTENEVIDISKLIEFLLNELIDESHWNLEIKPSKQRIRSTGKVSIHIYNFSLADTNF